ncbi:MAG: hypothetical protein ACREDH_14925, partial [Methylocella sp.]
GCGASFSRLAAAKRSVISLANLGHGSFERKPGQKSAGLEQLSLKPLLKTWPSFNPILHSHGSCAGFAHVRLLYLMVPSLTIQAKVKFYPMPAEWHCRMIIRQEV